MHLQESSRECSHQTEEAATAAVAVVVEPLIPGLQAAGEIVAVVVRELRIQQNIAR